MVEFVLAGGRGYEQGAVFFYVCRGAAVCFDDFKALYVQLPKEFYGFDEGVVERGWLMIVEKKSVDFYIVLLVYTMVR
ncbi:MAG: hypothetical protein Q3M30_06905 [Candidatus Electrothrix sp. Rat3]|nr:hypothetical protein [Candidatus Electrothrix rattekaaiensis]